MNYKKVVFSDLIEYIFNGTIYNEIVPQFNNGFNCIEIKNKKVVFIRKQEDVESITDNTIIPVLFITTANMYMDGKILYKNKFQDLNTLYATDKLTTKRINFFLIPETKEIIGNAQGQLRYIVNIDYIKEYDPYTIIAEEINRIIKKFYQLEPCGNYHQAEDSGKKLFFVPKAITPIVDSKAEIARIRHDIVIRSCYFT